jgi:hypothetical protein
MKNKSYLLQLQFKDRTVDVKKKFPSKSKAVIWARLCLDICGKDEKGNPFNFAMLFDEGGSPMAGWKG